MKIVFPMAGRGSRFQAASQTNPEYGKPKPLILVKGLPMIVWAVKSLPFISIPDRTLSRTKITVKPCDLTFICLEAHEEEYGISKILRKLFSDEITVVLIPEVTRGATETALFARPFIADDQPLIISDSDHYFDGTKFSEEIIRQENDVSGIIPVFKPLDQDPKWSFTLTDELGNALAVKEKDPVLAKKGAYANIGAYYFSKGATFLSEADEMIRENAVYGTSGKQEFYLAPIYQRLIQKGFRVRTALIDKVWGLGTPSDLEDFLKNYTGT